MAMALIPLLMLFSLARPANGSPDAPSAKPSPAPRFRPLYEPAYDSLLRTALDRLGDADYAAADSLLRRIPDVPARAYFRGLALAERCHDLGDTAALSEAESEWARLLRTDAGADGPGMGGADSGIYRGLAELQMSYVSSLRGARLTAARQGRRAAGLLAAHRGIAEAEAALALYDYYKAELLKGIAWLPFVHADRDEPLHRIEAAVSASGYLQETLRASLLWIYYDRGRYADGLPAIRRELARHPGNRIWRAMLADFHFRGAADGTGSLDSALSLHLALAAEYRALDSVRASPPNLPLGYLCSVGNLAKIYAARGNREAERGQLEIWDSSRYAGIRHWLPSSLVREVDALRKENLRRK
jgi:hypothetical protein